MNTFDRYLVVSECGETGYLLGFYPTIWEAEGIAIEHINHYNHAHWMDGLNLFEERIGYSSYEIHPSCRHNLHPSVRHLCKESYTAYVIDTAVENFSLKKFKYERANNVYAFDIAEYIEYDNKFATFFLDLMAN